MQPDYSSDMPMQPCMNCPYMMQGQCPYMGMMGTPYMGSPYMQPGQYPYMPMPEMKREDIEGNEEDEVMGEEDQYRHFPGPGPFFRPRPFFPRPFFRPFFPPFFFPPFFFPPFFF